MIFKNGSVFTDNGVFESVDVQVQNGLIAKVGQISPQTVKRS